MTYTANHPVDGDDVQTALSTYVNQNITHIVSAFSTEHVWSATTPANCIHNSNVKVGITTRACNAAAGDVAYTGIGFKPDFVLFYNAFVGTSTDVNWTCFGAYDGTNSYGLATCRVVLGTTYQQFVTPGGGFYFCCFFGEGANSATHQRAIGKTLDADGFTLTWAQGGTPTSAAASNIVYICIKLT